jgi:hypothetical protein
MLPSWSREESDQALGHALGDRLHVLHHASSPSTHGEIAPIWYVFEPPPTVVEHRLFPFFAIQVPPADFFWFSRACRCRAIQTHPRARERPFHGTKSRNLISTPAAGATSILMNPRALPLCCAFIRGRHCILPACGIPRPKSRTFTIASYCMRQKVIETRGYRQCPRGGNDVHGKNNHGRPVAKPTLPRCGHR